MEGKTCIVTGSNSGIGEATATRLAEMGATVVMAVRNRERGEKARDAVVSQTGNTETTVMIVDMSSGDSIRRFTDEFTQCYSRLDVLINNAGAFISKHQTSPEGFEMTLAVNYFGPFRLTNWLLPTLKSSAPSRVINITSGIQRIGKPDLTRFSTGKGYSSNGAYADSKAMLTMFTYALARRLEGTGVTVNALEPGFVATDLGSNSGSRMQGLMFNMMKPFQITPTQAAELPVYLASSPEVEEVTGRCFRKMKVIETTKLSMDVEAQEQLWAETVKTLGLGGARAA